MKIQLYYVYILTNANHKVLYTGVTNDLERRCFEHKHKKIRDLLKNTMSKSLSTLRNLILLI
jgi:predicted GIY-YIG superfamily endonuclease